MTIRYVTRWKEERTTSSALFKKVMEKTKKKGEKVFDMQIGDPVIFGFKNQELSDILIEIVKENWDMYPNHSPWQDKLRKAIANFEKRHRGVQYSPDDIIITPGVAGAFAVIHYSLLDSGDEMVSFEPAHYLTGPTKYFSYLGAKVVTCPMIEHEGWRPDVDNLRRKINEKTRGIFVNNPHNPTGTIYDGKRIREIVNIAGEYDIPAISDEVYGLITFADIEARSMAELAGDVPVIVLSGISKIFLATGWRVGYICIYDPKNKITALKEVIKKVGKMYGHGTSCMPTPIIAAVTKALERDSIKAGMEMVKHVQVNADYMYKRLRKMNGVSCVKPKGAFYAFPRVHAIGDTWPSDIEFLLDFAAEEGVFFRPGSPYGDLGEAHFRALLLPKIEILEEVCDRLERFIERYC